MAIRKWDLDGRITRNHAEPVFGETQISNYLRPQHAGDIGCRGDAATWSNLLSDAAAADHLSAFEYERGEAGTRQVSGRG
jgi:hypothetical protein